MPVILSPHPNHYAGSPLDRAVPRRAQKQWIEARLSAPDSLVVPVWQTKSLVREAGPDGTPTAVFLPARQATERCAIDGDGSGDRHDPWAFLGLLDGHAMFVVDLGAADDPEALARAAAASFIDLRSIPGLLSAAQAAVLAQARGLMNWRRRARFCGKCGTACEPANAGNVMRCPACGSENFPRTDPAVIMLVSKGDRALLGHSHRFARQAMYSTLAGFVEPGESLEEAVVREVAEETGVRIGNVTYHSSQPWPFPGSIMLGFTADALSDDITLDRSELADARWFTRAEIAAPERAGIALPRADSIARRLIEDWLAKG